MYLLYEYNIESFALSSLRKKLDKQKVEEHKEHKEQEKFLHQNQSPSHECSKQGVMRRCGGFEISQGGIGAMGMSSHVDNVRLQKHQR